MARPTKINELLWLLSFYKDGLIWTQLLEKHESSFVEKGEVVREVICFPMPTLARLLKKLIKKKLVEKTLMRSGRKGRSMGKYKIYTNPNLEARISSGAIHIMANMERNEEGKLFLKRTVRDCSLRLGGPKNIKRTVIMGTFLRITQV